MTYSLILPDGYKKTKLFNKDKWTVALRSGDHKQGRMVLTKIENDIEYDCCLGVKCKADGLKRSFSGYNINYIRGAQSNCAFYPGYSKLRDFPIGVKVFQGGEMALNFPTCNDCLGLTFNEIADIVDTLYEDSDNPDDV